MSTMELTRPLAEKQARMRTLASLMNTLQDLHYIAANKMGDFSFEEVQITSIKT